MKIAFSVPSGYHLRELVLPLKTYLEQDTSVDQVLIITPAAPFKNTIFSQYSSKFEFIANPEQQDESGHRKLLEIYRPDIVITDTVGHDALDYPILKAAAGLHIPTLTFIASWDNVWKIERMLKKHMPVAIADHFIVWNTMMKEHLLRIFSGLTSERVHVIGAPRMDYFWHTDKIPTKEQVYDVLGFEDPTRPLIHFATTELYPMEYVVEAVYNAIHDGRIPKNPYLYASVHPGGNMKNHESLHMYDVTVRYSFGRTETAPHPSFTYLPTQEDIYNLVGVFKHADVLINHSSSTALESLIADTPVINVKYGKPLDWWRWYRSMVYRDFQQHYVDLIKDGATYVVKNKKQLVEAVSDALTHPTKKEDARRTTIERMITTTDGTASQKVLEALKTFAKKS